MLLLPEELVAGSELDAIALRADVIGLSGRLLAMRGKGREAGAAILNLHSHTSLLNSLSIGTN